MFKIQHSAIKEIILGCNMQPQFKGEIIELVKTKNCGIRVLNSEIDDEEFKLNFTEIKY